MTVYELGDVALHISDVYNEMLDEAQIEKTKSLLQAIKLPADEIGMVALDHIIQKDGLVLIVALFNNKVDQLQEKSAEIHLHNGEKQVVASGLISEGGLPIMNKGEAHFWHFFLPHAAFIVSDVKLGQYYVEVIGKDSEGEDRNYSFYHIMQNPSNEEEKDNRARVTLMSSPIEYTSEISLEAITKKKTD